ncbi:hypothetical protein pipiens_014025 [Culex pipiens pipiens]
MTETEVAAAPAAAASPAKTTTPKKAKAPKAKGEKKPAKPAAHPPVAEMVLAAITTLKERNGSSLQAIKKYVATTYKCDAAKLSIFIRKALVKGVEKGTFTQRKGTGATGSFKLAVKEAAPKKAVAKKPAAAKKTKTAAAKKPAKKAAAAAKKPAGEKKAKAAAAKTAKKAGTVKKAKAAASPKKQKATKPSKTAAKKPKTPKPKKAAPAKKAAAAKKKDSPTEGGIGFSVKQGYRPLHCVFVRAHHSCSKVVSLYKLAGDGVGFLRRVTPGGRRCPSERGHGDSVASSSILATFQNGSDRSVHPG